jgi:phage shock protein A
MKEATMGIFTRTRDIISANINSMLDNAEDPQKLVTMMCREMEDTLIELKASCAGAMAAKRRIQRDRDELDSRAHTWGGRARRAVDRGRDDLARRALTEKRVLLDRIEALDVEMDKCDEVVAQYRSDIQQLEEKLQTARERRRVLVQRHIQARNRIRTEQEIRRFDTSEVMARFDAYENRVERMETEADLVNYGRKPTLAEEIENLGGDEDIERELQELKRATGVA